MGGIWRSDYLSHFDIPYWLYHLHLDRNGSVVSPVSSPRSFQSLIPLNFLGAVLAHVIVELDPTIRCHIKFGAVSCLSKPVYVVLEFEPSLMWVPHSMHMRNPRAGVKPSTAYQQSHRHTSRTCLTLGSAAPFEGPCRRRLLIRSSDC